MKIDINPLNTNQHRIGIYEINNDEFEMVYENIFGGSRASSRVNWVAAGIIVYQAATTIYADYYNTVIKPSAVASYNTVKSASAYTAKAVSAGFALRVEKFARDVYSNTTDQYWALNTAMADLYNGIDQDVVNQRLNSTYYDIRSNQVRNRTDWGV